MAGGNRSDTVTQPFAARKAAPIIRLHVRYGRSCCRAALWSARRLMTQNGASPPTITAVQKGYSITSSAGSSIHAGTVS
jgi:hypothetical protein